MYLIQAAIEQAIEHGHMVTAGWVTLVTGLLLLVVGMGYAIHRKESFRYWRVTISVLLLGFGGLSGMLDEVLKIIAKMIGGV